MIISKMKKIGAIALSLTLLFSSFSVMPVRADESNTNIQLYYYDNGWKKYSSNGASAIMPFATAWTTYQNGKNTEPSDNGYFGKTLGFKNGSMFEFQSDGTVPAPSSPSTSYEIGSGKM